tara:strand:- start:3121 stop:3876 length:756 start_codon:yes stop_codon:yes gene_type:complete
MKNLLIKIYRQLKLIHEIGISNYFKYRLTPHQKRVKIVVKGHSINVRKGTPDLSVAVSCLCGEFEILRHLLPENYDGVIVDAGGYIGTATIALKDIFPSAKLIVIEPSSENLEVLKDNVANLQNVKIIHGALVGTSEKSIQLNNRETGEWGFTVIAKPSDKPNASFIQETPAYRLSDLLAEGENIGLLKLDIEGGELSLLEHDMQSLRSIDAVFAELHDRIIPGCVEKFFEFSKDRILIKDKGEKFLSVKR